MNSVVFHEKGVEGHFVEAQQIEGPNNEGHKELTG